MSAKLIVFLAIIGAACALTVSPKFRRDAESESSSESSTVASANATANATADAQAKQTNWTEVTYITCTNTTTGGAANSGSSSSGSSNSGSSSSGSSNSGSSSSGSSNSGSSSSGSSDSGSSSSGSSNSGSSSSGSSSSGSSDSGPSTNGTSNSGSSSNGSSNSGSSSGSSSDSGASASAGAAAEAAASAVLNSNFSWAADLNFNIQDRVSALLAESDHTAILDFGGLLNLKAWLSKVDYKQITFVAKVPKLQSLLPLTAIVGAREGIEKARASLVVALNGTVDVQTAIQDATIKAIHAPSPVPALADLCYTILNTYYTLAVESPLYIATTTILEEGVQLVTASLKCVVQAAVEVHVEV